AHQISRCARPSRIAVRHDAEALSRGLETRNATRVGVLADPSAPRQYLRSPCGSPMRMSPCRQGVLSTQRTDAIASVVAAHHSGSPFSIAACGLARDEHCAASNAMRVFVSPTKALALT